MRKILKPVLEDCFSKEKDQTMLLAEFASDGWYKLINCAAYCIYYQVSAVTVIYGATHCSTLKKPFQNRIFTG
jgi:hypothetical protein